MAIRATVDRIEKKITVLLVRSEETVNIKFPTSLLPNTCKEGDILEITINIDKQKTEEMKESTSRLIGKLESKKY